MNLSGESDDEIVDEDDHPVLLAAAVAAAAATARSTLRPPSLQTLLEDMPHSADIPHSTSSGCDSEGKSKYTDKNSRSRKLKHNVIEAVNEPIQDVSTMLCPLYPHNPEVLLNELKSPADLLDFGEFSDCIDFGSGDGSSLLQVVNPVFDYVPPKLVSLFITDTGGHNPSYM